MLSEYVLLPCIFDTTQFKNDEICYLQLRNLRDSLIYEEAIVRNLYDGTLSKYINKIPSKHPNTRYILRRLFLRRIKPSRALNPQSCADWCEEALSSHKEEPLDGIIASTSTAQQFQHEEKVASIEKLEKANWWFNRRRSIGLKRNTNSYLQHLRLILNHANSLTFIDPYFDPVKREYQEFGKLLNQINRQDDPPMIEIHLCHLAEGTLKREFENSFPQHLKEIIKSQNLTVDIFIWDRFHDRFIITDIVGIQSGHGFGISQDPNETVTWTKLDRMRRDELTEEFSRNSTQHKLQHHFTIS